MGMEIVNLQGYMFEVGHGEVTMPADLQAVPGGPQPGEVIALHTLQLLDVVFAPDGTVGAVRKAYEIELSDQQRDELVRQLQGGAPQRAPAVAVAGAEVLAKLPHPVPRR